MKSRHARGVAFVLEDTPECFASYADLLESRGVARASGYSPTTVDRGTLAAAGIIATHYDIDTGSSISISGGPCNGGGLTLSADWKNRIDATASVCYVQHFDWDNYWVLLQTTTPPYYQLLWTRNQNKTNSLKYVSG